MTSTPRHQPQPPFPPQDRLGRVRLDPLPAEFEADLQALDELLAAHAASGSVPRHLADMVYDATVGLLWPRQTAQYELRPWRRALWSRVALAAAVALAFVISAANMRTVQATDEPDYTALLPADVEQLLFEPSPIDSVEVDYIIDTRDVTFEELSSDLRDLVAEMEM